VCWVCTAFVELEITALAGTLFDHALNLQSGTNHGPLSFVGWQREKF
jgi:hypothetical protein